MRSLNDYHRKVCSWLSQLGIQYVEEYAVGLYSIDIYISEKNLGIELDGPFHNKRKDLERDIWINEQGIPILRIPVGTTKKKAMDAIFPPEEEFES